MAPHERNPYSWYASDLSDPAERAAYLERECGDDTELRGRVEALLRANDASPLPPPRIEDATLDSGPGRHGIAPNPISILSPVSITVDHDSTTRPDVLIAGRYTLQQKIGEGWHGRGLGRQAIRAGQAQGRLEAASRLAWIRARFCNGLSRSVRHWR